MTSAPDSVSWTWATSMSPGPIPAASKAAAAASAVGDGPSWTGIDGLKTSNEPKRRGLKTAGGGETAGRGPALSPRAGASGPGPPPGGADMYLGGGGVGHLEGGPAPSRGGRAG